MLSFVQSWFAPSANPIGVDFGSDGLRMAQVESVNGEHRLIAAARADVPNHVRADPAAKLAFFAETARELWGQGNFRGRKAVLSLPASVMTIQHLRVPKMDDAALKQALPWECRGRLPYDPSHALLRHLVAGEVFADGEQKLEVIVMAAQREWVNQFLAAAARARLDVVGMNVEPKALAECFGHVYRRKSDQEVVNLFVDIGCGATRAIIAKGEQILFARSIAVGGDQLTRAVASATKASYEDAKILRIKLCHAQSMLEATRVSPTPQQPQSDARGTENMTRSAPQSAAVADAESTEKSAETSFSGPEAQRIDAACREPLEKLIQELQLCRRYHESTFPSLPVGRLVFVGGEARQRSLCQQVAQAMELSATVGDPMVRMGRTTEVGPESGIDRRLPQPDWAVALGLTMGPQGVPAAAAAQAAK